MKPKVKKIILLSIVAVACMFLRSDQVNAYTGKVTDENKITWNYTLENDEIVEIKYESGEIQENLYIPSYLNGYPLTKIQDKMRTACIKSFNKFYGMDIKLKEKQKGRNQDINVKDMSNYTNIKKQLAEKKKKLDKANIQTNKLDNTTKDINQILDNLKPAKFNKNNMVISNEDIQKIKNFTKDVKDTTKTVRSVNDLNVAIRDFEHSAFEIEKENRSLKYQIEEKDKEIYNLKGELSTKDKIINKLKEEKESIKAQLYKFKDFWHNIMGHFHKRICYDKDNNYKIVSDDLYKNGIFTDDENEIANNIARKVKPKDEINNAKNNRMKNDTRF